MDLLLFCIVYCYKLKEKKKFSVVVFVFLKKKFGEDGGRI